MRALAESTEMFAEASTDLPRLLRLVARRFSELVGEGVNIRLIEGDALVPVATHHPDPQTNAYLREFHDSTPLRLGEGISGRVISTGEPYFMPELDLEQVKKTMAPRFIPIFEKIGIHGMIVARLRARGINLGYLSLFRTSLARPPYTREELHLVKDLADRAALAIETSRLVDDLERRVAERTASLESANRELEAFAFSASHDLRSPLRAIVGFTRILEEEHELDDDARQLLARIRRNATRMNQLTEDLLRLSRVGHRAIEPVGEVDMGALASSVLAEVRAAHSSVMVDARVGDLPLAVGNQELLRQVWTNLLDNAVKYSGKQSVSRVEVEGLRDSGELRYTVRDNGAGFDQEQSDKLFGVFQRLHTNNEFEGTGVGLALVQRIVTRHGGRVWAEGRIGEGARFGFALPDRHAGRN